MLKTENTIVDIKYQQTGTATAVNPLGMREMQALAYEHRSKRFLLIKAPPASGKSRALMFIALDKLQNQGIKKVVVAVPEKSIGRSFKNTNLTNSGFFANWEVASYFNLTDVKNEQDKKGRFIEFFRQNSAKILVCAHATLRNGMKELEDEAFNDTLLAIDEFHHTSADANSNLGDVVRRVMNNSTGHIVAMTGSYFRGDGVPVLRAEDEARFFPVTYKKIAENEPTYLMAPVKIQATYKVVNVNSQKFEDLIHQVLKPAQFQVFVYDDKGVEHQPQEWFVVPLDVVDAIIQKIMDGSICWLHL